MAIENNKEKAQEGRRYLYRICPTCGVKLHIDARICKACGNQYNINGNTGQWAEERIYGSTDPANAVYSQMFNNVGLCMECHNTKKGSPCNYVDCFGTGKGRCDMCNTFNNTRFMCCQDFRKKDRFECRKS